MSGAERESVQSVRGASWLATFEELAQRVVREAERLRSAGAIVALNVRLQVLAGGVD